MRISLQYHYELPTTICDILSQRNEGIKFTVAILVESPYSGLCRNFLNWTTLISKRFLPSDLTTYPAKFADTMNAMYLISVVKPRRRHNIDGDWWCTYQKEAPWAMPWAMNAIMMVSGARAWSVLLTSVILRKGCRFLVMDSWVCFAPCIKKRQRSAEYWNNGDGLFSRIMNATDVVSFVRIQHRHIS